MPIYGILMTDKGSKVIGEKIVQASSPEAILKNPRKHVGPSRRIALVRKTKIRNMKSFRKRPRTQRFAHMAIDLDYAKKINKDLREVF